MILCATSLPGPAIPDTGVTHFDKATHFVAYAILGLLVARALRELGRLRTRLLPLALVAIAAFAALDEWHQLYIPGRSADMRDWIADLSGGALALLLAAARAPRPETAT